jgi:hypothetical protein
MCCPLILCREETMRGAEGLNKIPKKEQKGGMMEK